MESMRNSQEALKHMNNVNRALLVAMGALTLVALSAEKAIRHLQVVIARENIQEAAESDGEAGEPSQKMDQIVEDYKEGIN